MFDLELKRSSTKFEVIARTAHVCIGIAILGFAGWALTNIDSAYSALFVGFMLFGLLPISVGLFGRRKTVLQMLFFGYWF